MNQEEQARFEERNKVVHPVETQWHYPIMTKHGFTSETKEASGFVRMYVYRHPSGRQFRLNTGVNADYWVDLAINKTGYWSDLEPHLVKIAADLR